MKQVINKGYKFKILPTKEQEQFLMQCFGCARKIYNLNVNYLYQHLSKIHYKNGYINREGFKFLENTEYKKLYPYLKDVDSLCLSNAKINIEKAITKFNKEYDKVTYRKKALKLNKTTGKELTFKDLKGMPKFHSKKNNDFSYTTNNQNGTIKLVDSLLYLPKIKNPIKVKQHRELPKNSVIKNCTLSKECTGKYFVSICVEYEFDIPELNNFQKVLGLDYSQQNFYVSSENEKANYPHYYRKSEKKLIKKQRKLSRKVVGSNNWIKQKFIVAKYQHHISNQRLDFCHKLSTQLVNNYDAIIVEDIDLRALSQCLHLAKNCNDNGFGMFRDMLKYKLYERGKLFIKADKWFPSSKLCNECGCLNTDLKLFDREWVCSECGSKIDRDYNAAKNLKQYGLNEIQKRMEQPYSLVNESLVL